MLYREIIGVFFFPEIHIKHINAQCGQNIELLCIKLVVYNDHWALKG